MSAFSDLNVDAEGGFLGAEGEEENEKEEEEEEEEDASEDDEVLKAQIEDPSIMRLSRRIARSGVASRRQAERLVEEGVVTVNGKPVQTPALNVGPNDIVKVNVRSYFLFFLFALRKGGQPVPVHDLCCCFCTRQAYFAPWVPCGEMPCTAHGVSCAVLRPCL